MSRNRLNLRNVVAIAICLAGFTAFLGCEKNTPEKYEQENNLPEDGSGIYAAGYSGNATTENDAAAFWKDGNLYKAGLTSSFGYSIYVTDNDVYMVGKRRSGINIVSHGISITTIEYAMLWKFNNKKQEFEAEKQLSNNYSGANSVFVSGNDVYVAGYESISQSHLDYTAAVLWKNSVIQHLPDDGEWSGANSVFVSGKDVYVAGYKGSTPMLWKNGIAQQLTGEGEANSVFVSGKDVYVAGFNKDKKPTLWKNGVAQQLLNEIGEANSVFVSGNDVYVAGHKKYGNSTVAMLWKNGVAQILSDDTGVACSVYVSGNDVYVGGNERGSGVYEYSARLWKNGVTQSIKLEDGPYSMIMSVFVKGD